jgi:hypothetical protein
MTNYDNVFIYRLITRKTLSPPLIEHRSLIGSLSKVSKFVYVNVHLDMYRQIEVYVNAGSVYGYMLMLLV